MPGELRNLVAQAIVAKRQPTPTTTASQKSSRKKSGLLSGNKQNGWIRGSGREIKVFPKLLSKSAHALASAVCSSSATANASAGAAAAAATATAAAAANTADAAKRAPVASPESDAGSVLDAQTPLRPPTDRSTTAAAAADDQDQIDRDQKNLDRQRSTRQQSEPAKSCSVEASTSDGPIGGWYATRKAYRSVAYKTWTVGAARRLLNARQAANARPSAADASASDGEERLYGFGSHDRNLEMSGVGGGGGADADADAKSRLLRAKARKCASSDAVTMYALKPGSLEDLLSPPVDGPAPTLIDVDPGRLAASGVGVGGLAAPTPKSRIADGPMDENRNLLISPTQQQQQQQQQQQTANDCFSSSDYMAFDLQRRLLAERKRLNGCRETTPPLMALDRDIQSVLDNCKDFARLTRSSNNNNNNSIRGDDDGLRTLPKTQSAFVCFSSSSGSSSFDTDRSYRPDISDGRNPLVNGSVRSPDTGHSPFRNTDEAMAFLKQELITIRQKDFQILKQLYRLDAEISRRKSETDALALGSLSPESDEFESSDSINDQLSTEQEDSVAMMESKAVSLPEPSVSDSGESRCKTVNGFLCSEPMHQHVPPLPRCLQVSFKTL